ncbi:hypothetical protein HRbin15_02416 [bacterium HR15]|nr:hypothetical protein HRbin15_02416 [bacterium HR15]
MQGRNGWIPLLMGILLMTTTCLVADECAPRIPHICKDSVPPIGGQCGGVCTWAPARSSSYLVAEVCGAQVQGCRDYTGRGNCNAKVQITAYCDVYDCVSPSGSNCGRSRYVLNHIEYLFTGRDCGNNPCHSPVPVGTPVRREF